MKKVFLLLLILLLIPLGCGNKKGYQQISYNELKNKMENKETFILFIGKEKCGGCITLKGILNSEYKYSKEAPIYYIDTADTYMTEEEYIEFNSKISYSYTPTVLIIEEGKFKTTNVLIESADKYEELIEKLKEKGFIR